MTPRPGRLAAILSVLLPLVLLAQTGQPQPVVLRGWAELGHTALFSLECSHGRGSAWVAVDQPFFDGRILDFSREDNSVLFSNDSGTFRIELAQQSDFASALVSKDDFTGVRSSADQQRRPFGIVVEAGAQETPEQSFARALMDSGYQVPKRVDAQARFEVSNETVPSPAGKNSPNQPPEGTYMGPRAPTVTTSLTREEKIKRGIVGYTQ